MRTALARTVRFLGGVLALAVVGPVGADGVPEPGIVLYGKVWGEGGLVHAGELRWTYSSSGGTHVQVTVPLEQIVTSAGDCFSYRAWIPAASGVSGHPLAASVLPVTAATAVYTRSALVDGAEATIAGNRTTDTFSADERGKLERVDLAVAGTVIPTHGLAGTTAYDGRQAGAVAVQLSIDPAFTWVLERQAIAAPAGSGTWEYAFADLPAGSYYARAFKDADGDGRQGATEAHGVYAPNPVQLPPDATDVDILLVDVDTDHDGLPDWWEGLRPGGMAPGFDGDEDGDGASNGLEYAAGTDPDRQDSAPGPVARWRLDDGTGSTATDATGNLHDGTLSNGPVWATGIRSGALQFDGVDDQVTVSSSSDLDLTDGLTLQAWVRPEGAWTHGGLILSKHDGALDTGYSLGMDGADGRIELRLGAGFRVVSTGGIASGRWTHVAATLDAGTGTVTLYLNGRPDSTHPDASACTANALDFLIGNSASGGLPFAGSIDEPEVFAYARSAAAIAADASAVTAFALAGGAVATNQRTVTLDNVCAGLPLEYLASESADFAGATWQPYATAPSFTLSVGDGAKTVYFRVRSADHEWGPQSDSINLDTTAPAITVVDAITPDGIYGGGSVIEITVAFAEPVMVTGTPRLTLETGVADGVADYVAGSGTTILLFRYTVGAGEVSTDLDYAGTGALCPDGATVHDAAGNAADLTLPAPGAALSLGARRAIAVGNVHTVIYAAAAGGHVDGANPQRVVDGGSTTAVTAVPNACHQFARWSDGDLSNPRQDTNVTADITVTASFRDADATAPDGNFLAVVDVAAVAAGHGWWDLSGPYSTTANDQPLTLDLLHDAAGRLTGRATYTVAEGTTVTMPIRGGVKGSSGSVTMTGTLRGADPTRAVHVALTLDLTVDTTHCQLTGRLTGSIRNGGVTMPVASDVTLPIPAPMDGSWTLRFQLAPGGRAVTGTATLRLSNGVDYALVAHGKAGGATALLDLVGDAADPASKAIRVWTIVTPMEGGWARLDRLSCRGHGQAIGW